MFLKFLYLYHDSLLTGYQVVTRIYLTLKEKLYANNLFDSIGKYLQHCNICHRRSPKEPGHKSYHTRIPYNFRPMSKISAYTKSMPLSNQSFKLHLFATCEVSNYVIVITIQKANVFSYSTEYFINLVLLKLS